MNSVWEDVDPGLQNFDAGSSLDYVSGFSNTNTNAQFVYYNLTDGVNSNSILRVVTCTLPSGTVNPLVSSTLERFESYTEPVGAITGITDGYVARIDTSNVDSTVPHGTQQVIVPCQRAHSRLVPPHGPHLQCKEGSAHRERRDSSNSTTM